jgi:acyl-coenzyme A synthetase/AMP-(fatty) acid ligase
MNNFSQQLQEQFAQYGNRRAVIFQGQTISYATLSESILGAANFFTKQGIVATDKVMLRAEDSPAWLYTLLGLIHIGAVPVILSTQFISNRASEIATEANCRLVVINNKDTITGVNSVDIEDIAFDDTTPVPVYDYDTMEVGFMIASSGTTGKNKLVVHGHRSWRGSVDMLSRLYTFDPDEIVFPTSRMSFQYVWAKVFATLWFGETLVIHPRLIIGEKLLNFIDQHQITRLITSPPILLTLARVAPEIASGTMKTVRMVISGGEPIRDTVEGDIQRLYNQPLYQCYGSSEVITVPVAQNHMYQRVQSIGRGVPGVEFQVLNNAGLPCAVDEVGELYIKIECMALEYLNNPTSTQESFKDGWYKTNDLVRVDADGFYFFVGRKNDVKKINGIFVSPIEIELAMLNMPNIKDCMVGLTERSNGKSIVVANIVLEDIALPLSPESIRKFLTSRLESYKIPRVIKFIDDIPRTVTGKKMRSSIQH